MICEAQLLFNYLIGMSVLVSFLLNMNKYNNVMLRFRLKSAGLISLSTKNWIFLFILFIYIIGGTSNIFTIPFFSSINITLIQ